MRKWRAVIGPRNLRKAHQEGMQEGVELCIKALRDLVGEKYLSGFAAAAVLEKTLGRIKTLPT